MITRSVLSFALTAAFAAAQCPFSSFSVTVAGSGCNPVVAGFTTPIAATVSLANCSVQVNTGTLLNGQASPVLRVLVLGLSEVSLPVPVLGPGCVMVPSADLVLLQPVMSGPFQLAVPAVLPMPVQVTAQGAVLYALSPIAPVDWAISDALRLTLQ